MKWTGSNYSHDIEEPIEAQAEEVPNVMQISNETDLQILI